MRSILRPQSLTKECHVSWSLIKKPLSRVSNIAWLALFSMLAVMPSYSVAATFTVDSTSDYHQDGHLTLREAIEAANASTGADTVDLSGLAGETIILGDGNIVITEDLTITGDNGDHVIIDGYYNVNFFWLSAIPVGWGLHVVV